MFPIIEKNTWVALPSESDAERCIESASWSFILRCKWDLEEHLLWLVDLHLHITPPTFKNPAPVTFLPHVLQKRIVFSHRINLIIARESESLNPYNIVWSSNTIVFQNKENQVKLFQPIIKKIMTTVILWFIDIYLSIIATNKDIQLVYNSKICIWIYHAKFY